MVACSRYGSKVVKAETGTGTAEHGVMGGSGAGAVLGGDHLGIEVRVAASVTCSGPRRKHRGEPS